MTMPLSKGATEEEILKKRTLAEGCGLKSGVKSRSIPPSGKKVHRYCGYIKKSTSGREHRRPICGHGWTGHVRNELF